MPQKNGLTTSSFLSIAWPCWKSSEYSFVHPARDALAAIIASYQRMR